MEDSLCAEKHKNIDEKIKRHEDWLGEHEDKLDTLTKSDAKHDVSIENLCRQMGGLTKAIWGLVLSVFATLGGFFIFAVEKGIFK